MATGGTPARRGRRAHPRCPWKRARSSALRRASAGRRTGRHPSTARRTGARRRRPRRFGETCPRSSRPAYPNYPGAHPPLADRLRRFTESRLVPACVVHSIGGMTRKTRLSIVLCTVWLTGAVRAPAPSVWTVIAVDPRGDARAASLADAAQLSYRYDKPADKLWFRV